MDMIQGEETMFRTCYQSPVRETYIYAYTTPEIPDHDGMIKIGQTTQSVGKRISRQIPHEADIVTITVLKEKAIRKDGSPFTDHDFHKFLENEKFVERKPDTEYFRIDEDTLREYFDEFVSVPSKKSYTLRAEQQRAVDMTAEYFQHGGTEFLWNAKPRFGKTLTTYALIQKLGMENVLIVTNRPSVANSWLQDFNQFINDGKEFFFVTDNQALKGKKGCHSHDDFEREYALRRFYGEVPPKMIAFESLQGLKGSIYFGGNYEKLEWISLLHFDMLVIDESQEGVDTEKTDAAFQNIQRDHTLYLSGTPFKALQSGRFSEEQIFNWSYEEEQEAKENWNDPDHPNPYAGLPKLLMYTYQLSDMTQSIVRQGMEYNGATVEYAFDLCAFFETDEGKFVHEEEVRNFLSILTTQDKYPFSPEHRDELSHTLWLLNRVESAKALKRLLEDTEEFHDYEIVLAAGDGRIDERLEHLGRIDETSPKQEKKSYDKVKKAIKNHDKTITLSVGQLTVGVTIPEWSAVLMLCNMKSASSYMQAAFRAQTPWSYTKEIDGESFSFRKENAYVFDFDPARTLVMMDEFACNLSLRTETSRSDNSTEHNESIQRLLNFFPVIGEDDDGQMVQLDATQVLAIPRKLRGDDVVSHGFMSEFLLQNVFNVVDSDAAFDVLKKLRSSHQSRNSFNSKRGGVWEQMFDENGDPIPREIVIGQNKGDFGNQIYDSEESEIPKKRKKAQKSQKKKPLQASITLDERLKQWGLYDFHHATRDDLKDDIATYVARSRDIEIDSDEYDDIQKRVERRYNQEVKKILKSYDSQRKEIEELFAEDKFFAMTEDDFLEAENRYVHRKNERTESLKRALSEKAEDLFYELPEQICDALEQQKKQEDENNLQNDLYEFLRIIPIFIFAYGDEDMTLSNLDTYIEPDIFQEFSGITIEEFRYLRDGGTTNPITGEFSYFEGNLFDENVFNDAIQEFLKKKDALAHYYLESQTKDIFDYIPPFSASKRIACTMADRLEEQNPGCFDDPTHTFADIFIQSGALLIEIVKRLFRSDAMKSFFPNDDDRIYHILEEQIYGITATDFSFRIATHAIFGFDEDFMKYQRNIQILEESAVAAEEERLDDAISDCYDTL